eukprot:scaffold221318_cov37-Tisochrysis_lutea.AAC.4
MIISSNAVRMHLHLSNHSRELASSLSIAKAARVARTLRMLGAPMGGHEPPPLSTPPMLWERNHPPSRHARSRLSCWL